jgi:probable HAF family extracellular repeat protein
MFSLRRLRAAGVARFRGHSHACGQSALAALIGVALCLAQTSAAIGSVAQHPYTLTDVGTFGGPMAALEGPAVQITSQGAVLGLADTRIPDADFPDFNPFFFGFPDPALAHAFAWKDGTLTDLGALPGDNTSAVFELNRRGIGAGMSETGEIDPLAGYPAEHAVLFKRGSVVDLGTLPGGHESQAVAINDRGQVAGFGSNGIADPASIFPEWGTETRAFVWDHDVMHDLGTLGGPDADLATLNARGQAAGDSYTNATPNAVTSVPTTHAYLWTHGHMRDLGTLGGTQTTTTWLNQRGEVTGQSTLAGDQVAHPFLWDGHELRDLGTLGGDFGWPWHLNDRGDVVGWATPAGNETIHAFLWRHGTMTDLTGATSSACTSGDWVNNRDEVVGDACGDAALLWKAGKQYDLNTLVGPTDAHLTEAAFIDDRGEITALGTLPNGNQHVFLLRPIHEPSLASSPTRAAPVESERPRHHPERSQATPGSRPDCRPPAPAAIALRRCG